ncbi:MAG TPA: MerR family transcriptional regulator [Chthonomonadaceae bacterium]|nr:MerR family transcriptional regulator [Chthonomonadaceae bacterium]
MAQGQEEHFSIGELAQRAGVSVRTVRYYGAEGLLPPPDTSGRYARYSEQHLCRLRLIALWKRSYLPLSEIKARMAGLTTEDIVALLAAEAEPPPSLAREVANPSSLRTPETTPERIDLPANLAHFVEETLSLASDLPATVSQRRKRVLLISPMLSPASGLFSEFEEEDDITGGYILDEALGETWKRVPLAPGVELHFRIPNTPEARDALHRVIAQTQDAFKLL